jgi:hypothetical protein
VSNTDFYREIADFSGKTVYAHLWEGTTSSSTQLTLTRKNLGIRRSPSPTHLVNRMITIAQTSVPTESARKATAAAFYELCAYYDKSKENPEIQGAINQLRGLEIPAASTLTRTSPDFGSGHSSSTTCSASDPP